MQLTYNYKELTRSQTTETQNKNINASIIVH